jgi:hypothetical protein
VWARSFLPGGETRVAWPGFLQAWRSTSLRWMRAGLPCRSPSGLCSGFFSELTTICPRSPTLASDCRVMQAEVAVDEAVAAARQAPASAACAAAPGSSCAC